MKMRSEKVCLVDFNQNPLDDNVKLPKQLKGLEYSNIICGIIRGSLEAVKFYNFYINRVYNLIFFKLNVNRVSRPDKIFIIVFYNWDRQSNLKIFYFIQFFCFLSFYICVIILKYYNLVSKNFQNKDNSANPKISHKIILQNLISLKSIQCA